MRKLVSLPIAVVVVALVVTFAVRSWPGGATGNDDSGPKPLLSEMGPAPALTLNDLNGEPVSLSDYEGKIVLLNLWGTWCPNCVGEIPKLIELNQRYSEQGFVVLGVAIDEEGKEVVATTAKALVIDYPVLLDPNGMNAKAAKLMQGRGVPQNVLIDRRSHVRAAFVGLPTEALFAPGNLIEKAVQELLAEAPG